MALQLWVHAAADHLGSIGQLAQVTAQLPRLLADVQVQPPIPEQLLAGLGLLAPPALCDISVPPVNEGLPIISLADIRQIPLPGDVPPAGPGSATPRGRAGLLTLAEDADPSGGPFWVEGFGGRVNPACCFSAECVPGCRIHGRACEPHPAPLSEAMHCAGWAPDLHSLTMHLRGACPTFAVSMDLSTLQAGLN